MAKVRFVLRTTKKKTSLEPLYVRVIIGRRYDKREKTGLFVNPEDWNQKQEAFRTTVKNRIEKNRQIEKLRRFIEDAINELSEKEEIPKEFLKVTIDKFWNPSKYKDKKPVTLFSFIENFIKQSENAINPKTGKPFNKRTIFAYNKTFGLIKEFSEKKRKKYDFKDIDLDFYSDFVEFLQKKEYKANTVGKFIKNLNVFLNKATEEGINKNLAYKSPRFVKIQVETDNIALSETELKKLENLNLSFKPHLERVRDLFLVGCWTGLRFSDLTSVTPDKIQDGYINIIQSKTGDRVIIPLHPIVEKILDKYNGNLPPAISNQKTNQYLKEIGRLAGLNDTVTLTTIKGGKKQSETYQKWQLIKTHTARRSFATNLYKAGFPAHSIMRITGHKSESSFLKYIKVSPQEHAQLLAEFWAKRMNI